MAKKGAKPKWQQTTAVIFGVLIALLVLIAPSYSEISSFVGQHIQSSNQFTIIDMQRLQPQLDYSGNDPNFQVIQSDIKNYMYVPDYSANILVTFDSDQIVLGQPVIFSIKVNDTGTLKLQEPYFYVFIVDPSNHVKAMYPSGYGVSYSKMPYPSGDTSFNNVIKNSLLTNTSVSFKMRFITNINVDDEAGQWKVYTFLYDQNYVGIDGKPLTDQAANNAVSYSTHIFQVQGASMPASTVLGQALKLLASCLGAAGLGITVYEITDKGYFRLLRAYKLILNERLFIVGIGLIVFAAIIVIYITFFG